MRSRAVPVLAALAVMAGAAALLPPSSAAAGRPVSGSVQQAYRAGVRKNAAAKVPVNKAATDYRGPKLTLQTSYVGRDAAEPTIGVTRGGTAFIAAAEFDSIGLVVPRTEIRASHDGGLTWDAVSPTAPPPVNSMPPVTLDPYVWVDEDTDRVFSIDLYVGCSTLLYSDDEAETWQSNPIACGVPVNDHHTIVTAPPPAGTTMLGSYPNVVYYCVNQVADVACGRSLDGGQSFMPAGAGAFTGIDLQANGIVCGGLHGHIVGDRKGRLYLPKGHCGRPWVAVSEDGGLTWRRSQVSDISTSGTHTAVAVDDAENVYSLWWDNADKLPYLAISRDHGRTWGAPMMIAPPGVRQTNFPAIEADGTGRLAISFPGTTGDPKDQDRPWNYYIVTTTNALAAQPVFVSATANRPSDPIHRGACNGRCAGMFDFIDVIIAPSGEIWAAGTDTCTDLGGCNDKDGVANSADAALGFAVRQLGGPGLPTRRR